MNSSYFLVNGGGAVHDLIKVLASHAFDEHVRPEIAMVRIAAHLRMTSHIIRCSSNITDEQILTLRPRSLANSSGVDRSQGLSSRTSTKLHSHRSDPLIMIAWWKSGRSAKSENITLNLEYFEFAEGNNVGYCSTLNGATT